MKGYTLYFYSQSRSCILYFSVDGNSKKRALKMGREMAAILLAYYKALGKELTCLFSTMIMMENRTKIHHQKLAISGFMASGNGILVIVRMIGLKWLRMNAIHKLKKWLRQFARNSVNK